LSYVKGAHLPTSAHMLAHIVFMWAPTFGSALASVSGKHSLAC
jgi:hypothetical protein